MITTRLVPEVTLFHRLERVEREIAHQQKIPCQTCESVGVTDRPFLRDLKILGYTPLLMKELGKEIGSWLLMKELGRRSTLPSKRQR